MKLKTVLFGTTYAFGSIDQAELLKAMLGRLNICSKEYLIDLA